MANWKLPRVFGDYVRQVLTLGLTSAAIFIAASAARADVIYSNGTPDTTSGGNEATYWLQTENFELTSSSTINGAGVYIAGYDGIGPWEGVVDYSIFADNSGVPGTQLASGQGQNLMVTDTGNIWCCGGDSYLLQFSFQNDFDAAANTQYWFGIHLATDYNDIDGIFWVASGAPAVVDLDGYESEQGTLDNWFDNGVTHAFYLTDTNTVPEPLTLAVFGVGLAGAAAIRRRKSRAP